YGLSKRDRLRPTEPLKQAVDHLSGALALEEVDVYVSSKAIEDVVIELSSPASLIIPSWASGLNRSELVFLLARPLSLIALGLAPLGRMGATEAATLLLGAARLGSEAVGRGSASEAELAAAKASVDRAIPWLSRRSVEGAIQAYLEAPSPDLLAWTRDAHATARRAALLISDDLLAAAKICAQTKGLAEGRDAETAGLIRFWLSDTAVRFRAAARRR
ncbi:MAG: hypothetical protein OEY14_00005, partial [Myxococcales bacterium]|nr:hypothetical protein [Myxococcales bacterium]